MALKLVKRGLTGGDSKSLPPINHRDPIKIDIGGVIFGIFINGQKYVKFDNEYDRLFREKIREVYRELGIDKKEHEYLSRKHFPRLEPRLWKSAIYVHGMADAKKFYNLADTSTNAVVPRGLKSNYKKVKRLRNLKIDELKATWTPWCTFLDESNLEPVTVGVRFRRLDSEYNAFNFSKDKAEERAKKFTNAKHFYVYRDDLYSFDSLDGNTEEEQKLLIKQYYFKKEKQFERLQKEIRLFEKIEAMEVQESREPIPEDVRFAVWRRDGGKCVRCGSKKTLEFDHIIPFSKGGSNTERNIQLLCEKCNREKSNKI